MFHDSKALETTFLPIPVGAAAEPPVQPRADNAAEDSPAGVLYSVTIVGENTRPCIFSGLYL